MKCAVKFCGGCNPRYDRGTALKQIKELSKQIDFEYAEENMTYDAILVIGGCTSCCASYEQYKYDKPPIKIWDKAHIERAVSSLSVYMEEIYGLERSI